MIILGLLIYLPYPALLIVGLCIVFGHNLMDYQEAATGFEPGILEKLLHGRFFIIPLTKGHVVAVVYAFMPWSGVLILGYCMGRLFDSSVEPLRRKKILILLGLLLILLFIVLRLLNHYGDPFPWSTQQHRLNTILSFLNVNKYPPSLPFICVTLGPAMMMLAPLPF